MKTQILLALGLFVAACGGDGPKPAGRPPAFKMDSPAAKKAAGPEKPGKFTLYPQVSDEYRKQLTPDDFIADPTGDLDRDPFRSYLVDTTAASSTAGQSKSVSDRCSRRAIVAEEAGIRDMQLWGIVQQGTRSVAWFWDAKKVGFMAHEGDCLSKDKALVKDVSAGCVTLEIQPEALTGPAPPPHDERVCLHPEDLKPQ